MKKTLLLNSFLFFIFSVCQAQYDTTYHQRLNYNGNYSGARSELKITSSGTAVDGTNNYKCLVVQGNNFSGQADSIAKAFASIPFTNLLKAKAGVPVNLEFEFTTYAHGDLPYSSNLNPFNYIRDGNQGFSTISANQDPLTGQQGKSGSPATYDGNVQLNIASSGGLFETPPRNRVTYSTTVTFDLGRSQAWLVIPITEVNPNELNVGFTIIVPFVVEGPTERQVDSLGIMTEPKIPHMIIHNPPGDNSKTSVTNTGRKCRSLEEKVRNSETGNFYGSYKIGFKGDVGFILSLELEIYTELSVDVNKGSFETQRKTDETCITVSETLEALSNGTGAQGNDLFVGYGMDMAFGFGKTLRIENDTTVIDTTLLYRPIEESIKEFFLTKGGILNDINIQQAIVNDSINNSEPKRAKAQYQINVWQQVLANNDANIAAAASQTGENISFSGGASTGYDTSVEYNTSQSIEVESFVETTLGIEQAAYFGGSGFKLGAKMTKQKTIGNLLSTTGGQSENISVTRWDNDQSDYFEVKVVKDPVYGTPIFIVDSLQTKSSCPYEGGIELDQPKLEIVGTTSPTITIPNVTLGTGGTFNVKVCNNAPEERTYALGFVNESIARDLVIRSNGNTGTVNTDLGITQFATISAVPPNGQCKTGSYEIRLARADPAAPMSYQNVELVAASVCDSTKRASIFVNIDFAGPPPPTNVGASKTEICTGTPVTLTANCPVTTTPTWYTTAKGGFPLAQGTSVVVNPTTNTTYFVGCENQYYKRDRVATQLVLVGSPSTVLNLTSDFSADSLQIANTALTATNKINSPSRVKYKAGNSLTFNPGFEAKSGSTFEAEIGGCVE